MVCPDLRQRPASLSSHRTAAWRRIARQNLAAEVLLGARGECRAGNAG